MMKFSELSTPYVFIKAIKYGKNCNEFVINDTRMRQVKENLYVDEVCKSCSDQCCNLYSYFENHKIAFMIGDNIRTDENVELYFDLFINNPIRSETTFLARMDEIKDDKYDLLRDIEIELARVFDPKKADEYVERQKIQLAFHAKQRINQAKENIKNNKPEGVDL